MKKLLATTLGSLAAAGMMLAATMAPPPAQAAEKYTIALIPGLTTDAFYITMRKGAQAAADALGVDFVFQTHLVSSISAICLGLAGANRAIIKYDIIEMDLGCVLAHRFQMPAHVIAVDPAETVLEGVPTYKVTLVFDAPDTRIRSGMTANLDILTHERSGVLEIPFRAIVDDAGNKTVRVVSADGKSYTSVPVTVGLKGSTGTIEVLSGLSAGDKVVTYVK